MCCEITTIFFFFIKKSKATTVLASCIDWNELQYYYWFQVICVSFSILYNLCEVYLPSAVVCQCGADAISGDPLGGANLTPEVYSACVRHVLNLNKPTLFLGGG